MNKLLVTLVFSAFFLMPCLEAQELFYTREGRISFFSEAPLENIEAHNNRGNSVYNSSTGELEFSVLIKGFIFEKSLMQEHFNENFMESHKYPRASFKGSIVNHEKINLKKNGLYPFVVKGEIEIREIKKNLEAKGKFRVVDGKITAESAFELTVADFGIIVPAVVRDNIAREVEVSIKADYKELKR